MYTEWLPENRAIPTFGSNTAELRQYLADSGYIDLRGRLLQKGEDFIEFCLRKYTRVDSREGGRIGLRYDTNPCNYPEWFDEWDIVESVNDLIRSDIAFSACYVDHPEISNLEVVSDFCAKAKFNPDGTRCPLQPNWVSYSQSEDQYLHHQWLSANALYNYWDGDDDVAEELAERCAEHCERPEDRQVVKGEIFVEKFFYFWALRIFSEQWSDITCPEAIGYQVRWGLGKTFERSLEDHCHGTLLQSLGLHAELAAESNELCTLCRDAAKRADRFLRQVLESLAELFRQSFLNTAIEVRDDDIYASSDQGRSWTRDWSTGDLLEILRRNQQDPLIRPHWDVLVQLETLNDEESVRTFCKLVDEECK